jgi:exosortase family protein XrtF
VTYFILTLLYQGFLSSFESNKLDSVSKLVARNTGQVLVFFNADVEIQEDKEAPQMMVFYKGQYIARIIEGCNAISVIILFVSFIVSFSGKFKSTLFFIVGGSLIIYILNVMRIALLSVLLYSFPKQEALLHDVLFPLFIYGFVFILWVIWINKFSLYAKKTLKS